MKSLCAFSTISDRDCAAIRFFRQPGTGLPVAIRIALLLLVLSNLVVIAGWGDYFPWAIPMLYAQGKSFLAPVSY